jgi:hypothetical protein
MHYSIKTLNLVEVSAALLLIACLLTKCKKEYSYEGGTAEFSILSLNGICVNTIVSGHYVKDSPLGSSNTVQLTVFVTTVGMFNLQTNSRSGFVFSSTGSFSDTGIQTINLLASGKPDSLGDFEFTPELASSCSFIVSVTGKQTPDAGYTIAGDPNSCSNIQVSGSYQINKMLTDLNTVVVNVDVVSPGNYDVQTDTLDGFFFSASGYFNQTGNQPVTLKGSGIPLQVGDYQFNLTGNGSACKFPISVGNAGDSATYSIASGVDHCYGYISGAYTAGTALNATNTYTLTVYVTFAGLYSITTQAVNGMIFSNSGRFTRLGTNYVTLEGHGTPAQIGNFIVTPAIVGPAPISGQYCSFNLAVK